MKVSTEQLPQLLTRDLAPLYTVFGDEPLLALEATDRIRARARSEGYSEREVLTAEQHFDWSQLRMSAQSQSLFAARRILELRIPSGKPGNEGGQALQDIVFRSFISRHDLQVPHQTMGCTDCHTRAYTLPSCAAITRYYPGYLLTLAADRQRP